uniref:Cytochrome b5 heme-binding domain-containing protein n=1 Tax=Trieres chinensis TaxID=1514140 RepID=A0A7S1ZJY9_TRICV
MSEFRPMNDSTMPPPKAAARRPQASSKASKPAAAVSRRKVGVRKGFGLYDWTVLLRHARDLAQRKGAPLRPITREEIKEHSSEHDAWISLNGKVYNITPYLAYHPGGINIMKPCLGRDATALFNKYHRWVNVDGLVGALLLGTLDETKRAPPTTGDGDDDDGFATPAPRPPKGGEGSLLPSVEGSDDGDDEGDDLNPWEK